MSKLCMLKDQRGMLTLEASWVCGLCVVLFLSMILLTFSLYQLQVNKIKQAALNQIVDVVELFERKQLIDRVVGNVNDGNVKSE